MVDQKIHDYVGVVPEKLRLANIHRAVAHNVYLTKDYYGLEVFALALLTRAYLEASSLRESSPTDERIGSLLQALASEIKATESAVDPEWLKHHHKGWFASINEYHATVKTAGAQPGAPQASRR